ncbi:MAG: hypothetical protein HYY10_03485 [Candidatus Liptonbacteria bacterium]|nr:hypothetical protein [Candidatus Liptonbacteria bacterium]
MTTNAKGEEIIISSTYEYDPSLFGTENDIGGFTRVSSMINGNYTYQLSTYPLSTYLSAHISSPDNQEILIDSIAKKRPVFVRIEFKSEKKDIPIEMTNCAQIYGAGEHKIVNMRGKSSASKGLDVASTLDKYRKNGFEQINPLKSYSDSFSYFADLANHDDTKWSMLFGFFTGANNKPREISACGSDASQYFFHTGRLKNRAYAPYGSGVAFSPATITLNAIHEMAHSFVGIEDEYTTGFDVTLYYANCAPPGRAPHWGTIDQSRFSGGNGFYYGDYLKGCQLSSQYRPSADSIMQGLKSTNSQFNVVSCGYFLQAIKKGTASLRSFPMSELIANWEECKKMDGIIKPLLVDADPLIGSINNSTRLLAGISPILTNNGTPDSMIKLNFSSPYITLESFAPDGTITGEVFESANENTPVGKPILNRTTSTAQTSSTLIISKPGIDSLRAMVRDLQAQIQVLRDKIDAIKCSRGLAPCKEKVLIPSKQLLPALPKEQQLGNILNTLQIFIESLSNPKR